MLPRTALGTVGLLISLAALCITLWIVLPAPAAFFWMLSVAASEWSLWFGLAGLIGALIGGVVWRLGSRAMGGPAVVCGLSTLVLAAVPLISALRVAQQEEVPLSLRRYFLGVETTSAVAELRDVVYAEVDQQPLRLDVYRPNAPARQGPMPTLVVIHGGGWNAGTKGDFPRQNRALARQGYVVFDIDYRLAGPKTRFPAPLADVKCAIGWVKRNAAMYGADPRRIGLLGRSAGAHLALLAGYTANEAALPASCAGDDTSVQAVVSFYAPVDLIYGYTHPPRPDFYDGPAHLRNFLGATPDAAPDAYKQASPRFQVRPGAPPTLVIHGGHDQIVRSIQARFLDEALQKAGVPHRLVLLPWANHGFDYAINGWGSQIVEPILLDFLRTNLQQ